MEVVYLDEKPECEEGPFLHAERRLINAVAERLGHIIERKQAEDALQESEARYKALFAGAPEGMVVADPQTRQFRYANPAMCRMFGYTEEEFMRIGVADIHPKESLDYVLAEFEALARGEKPLSPDLPCQRKDGSSLYADVSAVAMALDGRTCLVGFFTDVTERKQVVEALRESEARYKALFAGAPEGMLVADLQTKQFRYANPAMCRMFGYTEEEFLRIGVADIHPKESLDYVLAEFEAQARGEKLLSPDLPCQRKDGSLLYANVSAIMVVLDGRKCNVGFFTDVTERKQMQDALRESEARYRHIFDNVHDIFYRTDAQGIITEISPSVERYGYTPEELIGTQVMNVYEDPEERSGLLEAVFEQGQVIDYELHLKTADGRQVPMSISARLLRDADGTFAGTEGILRDITERKRMEEALREQAQRDPLTGVLNHGAIVAELRSLVSSGSDGTSHTVAMVDVDGLKATNDAYGHQVGDTVLKTVAGALSRDGALVGRYGGDEFVAILPGANRQEAERYRAAVVETLASAGLTDPEMKAKVPVAVSIGLATYPTEAARVEELIRLADSEMYAAKRQRPFRPLSPTTTEPPARWPRREDAGRDRAAPNVPRRAQRQAATGGAPASGRRRLRWRAL